MASANNISGGADFADSIQNGVGSIASSSDSMSKTLSEIRKMFGGFSKKLESDNNKNAKGMMDSLLGVKEEVRSSADSEAKYRQRMDRENKAETVRNKRAEKAEEAFKSHLAYNVDELTGVQKASKVSMELWNSRILAHMRDIIDGQHQAYKEIARQRGLGGRETESLLRNVSSLAQEMNRNGGYLFNEESVRKSVLKLAEAGLTTSAQKLYAPALARMEELFGGMTNNMAKGIGKFDALFRKSLSEEERRREISAIQGLASQLERSLDIQGSRGELAESGMDAKLIQNLVGAGFNAKSSIANAKSIMAGLASVKATGDEDLANVFRKNVEKITDILGNPNIEGNAEYISQIASQLSAGGGRFAGMSAEDVKRSIKAGESSVGDIAMELMKVAIQGSGDVGRKTLFESLGMSNEDIRVLTTVGKINQKEIFENYEKATKLAKESTDEQIKHLDELSNRLGETQSILEKIDVLLENFLGGTGIGAKMMPYGNFREIGTIVGAIGGVVGGRKLLPRLKGLFGGASGAGAGAGVNTGIVASASESAVAGGAGKGSLKGILGKAGGAIAGLGLALYDLAKYSGAKSESEKKERGLSFSALGGTFAGGAVGAKAGAMLGAVGGPIGVAIGTAIGGIMGALGGDKIIKELVEPIWDDVKPVVDMISDAVKPVTEALEGIWDKTKQFFIDVFEKIGNGVKNAVDWVKELHLLDKTIGLIRDGIVLVSRTIQDLPDNFRIVVATMKRGMGVLVEKALDFVKMFGVFMPKGMTESLGKFAEEMKQSTETAEFSKAMFRLNRREGERAVRDARRSGIPVVATEGGVSTGNGAKVILAHPNEKIVDASASRELDRMAERRLLGDKFGGRSSEYLGEALKHVNYSLFDSPNAPLDANGDLKKTWDGSIKWGGVDRKSLSNSFVDRFIEALGSEEVSSAMERHGLDGITIISGKRSVEKQADLHRRGFGAKVSAHLAGKAVDFNLSKDGSILKAFTGSRDGDSVNQDNLEIYKDIGKAIATASGGMIRSGAFFSHLDPNHVEMNMTAKEKKDLALAVSKFEVEQERAKKTEQMIADAKEDTKQAVRDGFLAALRKNESDGAMSRATGLDRWSSLPQNNTVFSFAG